jgi:hypothetical protein
MGWYVVYNVILPVVIGVVRRGWGLSLLLLEVVKAKGDPGRAALLCNRDILLYK